MQGSNSTIEEIQAWLRFMKRMGIFMFHGSQTLSDFLQRHDLARKESTSCRRRSLLPKTQLTGSDESLENCQSCLLAETRKTVVSGYGSHDTDIMIIGDFPSLEDEKCGRPFSGQAGELLIKMLRAINIRPGSVYMTNILKCRPPSSSLARMADLSRYSEQCRKWLDMELSMISPAFVMMLGEFSATALLGKRENFSSTIGLFHDRIDCRFMAIYHPLHILRLEGAAQIQCKREVWAALQIFEKAVKERRRQQT